MYTQVELKQMATDLLVQRYREAFKLWDESWNKPCNNAWELYCNMVEAREALYNFMEGV